MRRICVFVLFLLCLSGCAASAPSASPSPSPPSGLSDRTEGYDKGQTLPDFTVPLIDGGEFVLSEQLGKPVLINLFTTWCGPCVAEMPDLDRLYAEYGDEIAMVVIDMDDGKEATADLAADKGYSFPVGYLDGWSFGTYSVEFIPQTFVLDADGVIVQYYAGANKYDTYKAALDAAMG